MGPDGGRTHDDDDLEDMDIAPPAFQQQQQDAGDVTADAWTHGSVSPVGPLDTLLPSPEGMLHGTMGAQHGVDATQSPARADSQQHSSTPARAPQARARNAGGAGRNGAGGGWQSLHLPAKRGAVVVDVDPASHAAATELAGPDIRALLADRSSLMDEQVTWCVTLAVARQVCCHDHDASVVELRC